MTTLDRSLVRYLALALTLATASTARAQEAPAADAPPAADAASAEPAEAPVSADPAAAVVAAPVAAAPAAAPVTTVVVAPAPAPAPEREDYARVRFHAALVGGGFFGDVAGGMGGLTLGLGVQLNQYFGLFYQAHGLLGAFIEGGQDGAIAALLYNSAIFDVTLGHFFQFGAGPSLDFLAGCAAGASGAGCGDGGPFFGLDGRVALALGGNDVGTRGAFVVSADIHPTFYPGGVSLAFILGLGGQVY